MHELALHVRDIDVYHTDGDKSAYNHGLFWHTWHYVDVGTSNHRAHPSRTEKDPAGVPSQWRPNQARPYAEPFLIEACSVRRR